VESFKVGVMRNPRKTVVKSVGKRLTVVMDHVGYNKIQDVIILDGVCQLLLKTLVELVLLMKIVVVVIRIITVSLHPRTHVISKFSIVQTKQPQIDVELVHLMLIVVMLLVLVENKIVRVLMMVMMKRKVVIVKMLVKYVLQQVPEIIVENVTLMLIVEALQQRINIV